MEKSVRGFDMSNIKSFIETSIRFIMKESNQNSGVHEDDTGLDILFRIKLLISADIFIF